MNDKLELSDQDFEQWLQQELQGQAAYIPDDGFTEQLMAQLPAQPKAEPLLKKPNRLVVWAALISSAIVLSILPVQDMLAGFADIFLSPRSNWFSLMGLGLGMGALASLVVWNDRARIFDV
ncbi:MAG: hypothetical protein OIF35_05195 [Cellvibrionaceae bacterium]|nr:hypothetical protein [Cellvibrionaceae bacterium]MCV6626965.1 hypothetical protein [Cellvibrionaceae bacterium]